MSEVSCLNYFPCFPIEDQTCKKIKENTYNYAYKAVVVTTEGIKKIAHAAWFIVSQAASIVALALLDLGIVIGLSPFIRAFPPANAVFPMPLIKLIHTTMVVPTVNLTRFLTAILPPLNVTFSYGNQGTVNFSRYLAVGFSEEFVFRGIIQQGVLKELPKMALRQLAPEYVETVDHKVARVARVIFTSAIFALGHAAAFGNSPGMLLPQFIGGVLYSSLIERGHPLWKLALVHCVYDLTIMVLIGGI